MARMLLLEQTENCVTYATLSNEGLLAIENRYLNSDGSLDFANAVVIEQEGVKKLFELLSIEQSNKGVKPTKSNVGAGADFQYMLSQQLRDRK